MNFHDLPCHVTHCQAAAVYRDREHLETADATFRPYQLPPFHVKGMPSASEDAGIGGRCQQRKSADKGPRSERQREVPMRSGCTAR